MFRGEHEIFKDANFKSIDFQNKENVAIVTIHKKDPIPDLKIS